MLITIGVSYTTNEAQVCVCVLVIELQSQKNHAEFDK